MTATTVAPAATGSGAAHARRTAAVFVVLGALVVVLALTSSSAGTRPPSPSGFEGQLNSDQEQPVQKYPTPATSVEYSNFKTPANAATPISIKPALSIAPPSPPANSGGNRSGNSNSSSSSSRSSVAGSTSGDDVNTTATLLNNKTISPVPPPVIRTVADYDEAFETTLPAVEDRVPKGDPAHTQAHIYPTEDGAATPSPLKPPVDTVVLYPFGNAQWEKDFLLRDTLPISTNGGITTIFDVKVNDWNADDPEPKREALLRRALFNDSRPGSGNAATQDPDSVPPLILILHLADTFSHNCPQKCLAKLRYYKPAVVIVLSDEHGRTSCVHRAIEDLRGEANIKLVMRQYSKRSSGGAVAGDVKTMPLGYMAGYELPPALQRDNLRKASLRSQQWAFVGHKKGDRAHMMRTVGRALPQYISTPDGGIEVFKMSKIYSDSKFVLSPRGFIRMDCFRLYEASRMGAIPVVVPAGTTTTYAFDSFIGEPPRSMPPWIYANSWQEAAQQMKDLIDNPTELDARQAEVLRWWDRVVFNMRRAVYDAVLQRFEDDRPIPTTTTTTSETSTTTSAAGRDATAGSFYAQPQSRPEPQQAVERR